MNQADKSPVCPSALQETISLEAGSPRSCASTLETRLFFPDDPPSGPEAPRAALIERLKREIRVLERHAPALTRSMTRSGTSPCAEAPRWTLGAPGIDGLLGPEGLDCRALHEVKPAAGGTQTRSAAQSAALAFALRLALRCRLAPAVGCEPGLILWCWTAAAARETGRLHGPGLAALGLDAGALLIVETARAADALWALEEGLKSKAIALAVGVLPGIALTPARRLALAAEEHLTPALLVTDARSPATAATSTRWRIAPERSGRHPFDAQAPGPARAVLTLERCRGRPNSEISRVVEWSHETHRFRVAADVADRAPAPAHGAAGPVRHLVQPRRTA